MREPRPLGAPAGGMAPPAVASLPDGTQLDLRALAHEISEAHLARHPEELERYGEAARAWCTHDNQHLLNWAALDLAGSIDFDEQLRWLARILTARDYPIESLVDNLRTGEAVVKRQVSDDTMDALADRLATAASALGA